MVLSVVYISKRQKERERGKEKERERSLRVTRYFIFLQAFTVFAGDAGMQEAVVF